MSQELTITSDLQKSLDSINAFKTQIDLIGTQCKQIQIKDELTLAIAQQNLSKANQMALFIEEKRVQIKAPYLAAGKLVDETAKKIVGELTAGISHIKAQVSSWEKAKQLEAKAKQDAIDAELEAKKALLETVPLTNEVVNDFVAEQESARLEKERVAAELASNKTRGIRYQWKFELVDKSKVPLELLIIDEAKVREYMKENKESLKEGELNGIKFYKDIIVTA